MEGDESSWCIWIANKVVFGKFNCGNNTFGWLYHLGFLINTVAESALMSNIAMHFPKYASRVHLPACSFGLMEQLLFATMFRGYEIGFPRYLCLQNATHAIYVVGVEK